MSLTTARRGGVPRGVWPLPGRAPAPRAHRPRLPRRERDRDHGHVRKRTGGAATSSTATVRTACTTWPDGAFPGDGPQSRGRHRSPARPWLIAAMDVAHDAARQRDVEELRPVVGRDGRSQRQVDAEAAGHDLPAPRAASGRQHRDARSGRQRAARRPCAPRRGTGRCRRTRPSHGERHRHAREPEPPRSHMAHGSCVPPWQSQEVGMVHGDGEPAGSGLRQTRASRSPRLAGQLRAPAPLLRRATPPSHSAASSACAGPSRQGLGRTRTSAPSRRTPRRQLPPRPGPSRRPPSSRWWASKAAPRRESRGSAGRESTRPTTDRVSSIGRRRAPAADTSGQLIRGQHVQQRRGGDEGASASSSAGSRAMSVRLVSTVTAAPSAAAPGGSATASSSRSASRSCTTQCCGPGSRGASQRPSLRCRRRGRGSRGGRPREVALEAPRARPPAPPRRRARAGTSHSRADADDHRASSRRPCQDAGDARTSCSLAATGAATRAARGRPGAGAPQLGVAEPGPQRGGEGRGVAGRDEQSRPGPSPHGRVPPAPRRPPWRSPAGRAPGPGDDHPVRLGARGEHEQVAAA